jgi:hypothetical protein
MAKNLGRKFATMSEDERRRFALEAEEGTDDRPAELAFDEPRNEDNKGLAVRRASRQEDQQSSESE